MSRASGRAKLKSAPRCFGPNHARRAHGMGGSFQPGDILFAVLQTAINSDEPGPVRAQVVGERFKDAMLLGTLATFPPVAGSRPERVQVAFNVLTTPTARPMPSAPMPSTPSPPARRYYRRRSSHLER